MSRGLPTLAGRVAVVTGAASGIGRALACELAAAGSRLALIDVDAAGLAETLRHELAGTNVTVACVHPGGIRTNIVRRARFYADATGAEDHADAVRDFERLARTTPEAAARRIVAGIRRGEARILIGRDARVLDLMQRLLPVGYGRVLRGGLRRMRAVRQRAAAAPRAAFPCSS